MKSKPKYGYYPWWPENGDDWIHPEDINLARRLIPSMRIFRRDGELGPFVVLHYGIVQLRVQRTLWQEVESEGFEIGDWVEVLARSYRNTPRTAVIREVLWDGNSRRIHYQVSENDLPIPNLFTSEDLQHIEPPRVD